MSLRRVELRAEAVSQSPLHLVPNLPWNTGFGGLGFDLRAPIMFTRRGRHCVLCGFNVRVLRKPLIQCPDFSQSAYIVTQTVLWIMSVDYFCSWITSSDRAVWFSLAKRFVV